MKLAATRDLFCYWDALRGNQTAPERVDIDPSAIRASLADTFILELDTGRLFPFRLAGTRLCTLVGHELRGQSALDLFDAADRIELERLIDAVADESAAVVIGIIARSNQNHALAMEMLLLPLRHRSEGNVRILGSLVPSEVPLWINVCHVDRLRIHSVRILWPAQREMIDVQTPGLPITTNGRRMAHLTVIDGGRA